MWTKVLVADLLLIFLNPCRHAATCDQQLAAARANRLVRISGLPADAWMNRTIGRFVLISSQDASGDPRVDPPSSKVQAVKTVGYAPWRKASRFSGL